jgi:hypothetical protein
VCDEATHAYECPAGAWPYARADASPSTCLPFSDSTGGVLWVGGSLVRVATDDGRCLWIAEDVQTSGGRLRNVGFVPDRTAPFGSCPSAASFASGSPAPVVTMEGGDDPNILVQIASSFRFAGKTHVLYRLFAIDPNAVFGVTLLGGGLGHWDASSQRVVVQGPSAIAFSTGLGLGDAALVTKDFAFVWGCPKANGLTDDCIVTRFDREASMQLFSGSGWIGSQNGSDGATVFDAGPWVSSVVAGAASAGNLLHVYSISFSSTLESHVGAVPEGPWTAGPTLAACDLAASDDKAFCAGPVVHEELVDPTRPGELPVSYGVGTTATDQSILMVKHPKDYWSRLVWVAAP